MQGGIGSHGQPGAHQQVLPHDHARACTRMRGKHEWARLRGKHSDIVEDATVRCEMLYCALVECSLV